MDPKQIKRGRIKLTAGSNAKGRPVANTVATTRQAPKRPRMASSSAPPQTPQLRNDLQIQRYNHFQGSKCVCGRQVDQNAYAHADFYPTIHKYLEDMDWLGLSILPGMHYSPLLANEFYSGFLMHANEYENPVRFKG